MSFTTWLSKGAPGGDSAVAREVTTGMGDAVWSADVAELAETTGIGMTAIGMGGCKAGTGAGAGTGTGTGGGAGGRGWWL